MTVDKFTCTIFYLNYTTKIEQNFLMSRSRAARQRVCALNVKTASHGAALDKKIQPTNLDGSTCKDDQSHLKKRIRHLQYAKLHVVCTQP